MFLQWRHIFYCTVWTLPNGSTQSGTNTTVGNEIVLDTETSNPNDYYSVKMELFDSQGVKVCSRWFHIQCYCGINGIHTDFSDPKTIGGRQWRAKVEIWVKHNPWAHSIGLSTTSQRKSTWGFWHAQQCDELYATFEGTIIEGDSWACPDLYLPFSEEWEANGNFLSRDVIVNTNDPGYLPNSNICESKHYFKEAGVTVWYKNGSKLFLN